MAKYKVDKKELSLLLETYVANQEVRSLSELHEISAIRYAEQTENLLRRGETLGQDNLRQVACSLATLGSAVLDTYNINGAQLTQLYGGLVTLVAAGYMKEWDTLTNSIVEQVNQDKNMLFSYQFIPQFYETICKPNLTQMTSDAVNHAISYLNSKSSLRGIQEANYLLTHDECFGPKIGTITEDDITTLLDAHPDDEHAATSLCRTYRVTGIGKVTPNSRAISMHVSPLPGRVEPKNITFRYGMPSRLPAVAARAVDYLAGKRTV